MSEQRYTYADADGNFVGGRLTTAGAPPVKRIPSGVEGEPATDIMAIRLTTPQHKQLRGGHLWPGGATRYSWDSKTREIEETPDLRERLTGASVSVAQGAPPPTLTFERLNAAGAPLDFTGTLTLTTTKGIGIDIEFVDGVGTFEVPTDTPLHYLVMPSGNKGFQMSMFTIDVRAVQRVVML